MNETQAPMGKLQARVFCEAREGYLQRVARMTRHQLAAHYAAELAERGLLTAYGVPRTKDELISAALDLRYPNAKHNEAIHVLHHDGITNDGCCWCCPDPCPVCGAIAPCVFGPGESGAIVNGRHVLPAAGA